MSGREARQPDATCWPPTGESPFNGARLLASLGRLPVPRRYWVGFSGGADSTALLQAMHESRSRLPAAVHAMHFDHGLQADASRWQEHCRAFCEARRIPYRSERLEIDRSGRAGLEQASRNSRYRAVARILGEISSRKFAFVSATSFGFSLSAPAFTPVASPERHVASCKVHGSYLAQIKDYNW